MPSFTLFIASFIFIAASIITFFADFNWQAALILFFMGIGSFVYVLLSRD